MTVDLSELKALALKGLPQMFESESKLFCYKLKRTEHGLVREGASPRYTIISLLGLDQMEAHGSRSPIPITDTVSTLLKNTDWVDNIGDLGLVLWLCALCATERLEEVYFKTDVEHALERHQDVRMGRTMELAWFLSGLAHAAPVSSNKLRGSADLALKTLQLLTRNQGETGFFGHLAPGQSLPGKLRGRIGSFADQVYPIYALAKYGQAYRRGEAIRRAEKCAEAICNAQGPLGQWWWHYDSSSGKVPGRYPVYSVHQDGMAPMALFALSEVSQHDFTPWIWKGLQWIVGNNELGFDMRDTSSNVIWRSFYQNKYKQQLGYVSSLLGLRSKDDRPPRDLKVLTECRPYHLGWLLYAFAGHSRSMA